MHHTICFYSDCINMNTKQAVNAKCNTENYGWRYTRIRWKRTDKVPYKRIKAKDFCFSFVDLKAVDSKLVLKLCIIASLNWGIALEFSMRNLRRNDKSCTYLHLSSNSERTKFITAENNSTASFVPCWAPHVSSAYSELLSSEKRL